MMKRPQWMSVALLPWALCFGVFLVGCDMASNLKRAAKAVVPAEDEKFAKQFLKILREGDMEKANSLLDPQFVRPGDDSALDAVASFVRQTEPASLELVGCNVVSGSGRRRTSLTYQCQLTESWLVTSVVIDTIGGKKRIVGIHVNPIAQPLGEGDSFTLSNKGARHYAMLFLAVGIPILILCTLVVCIRTRMTRLKWLWIIFILVGIGKAGMNWTTGGIVFNPLSFHVQLLGASVAKQGPYAPWFLSVSVPLGAILFMAMRKKLSVPVLAPVTGAAQPKSPEPTGETDSQNTVRETPDQFA